VPRPSSAAVIMAWVTGSMADFCRDPAPCRMVTQLRDKANQKDVAEVVLLNTAELRWRLAVRSRAT
jgi:hypothetical protein